MLRDLMTKLLEKKEVYTFQIAFNFLVRGIFFSPVNSNRLYPSVYSQMSRRLLMHSDSVFS